MIRIIDEPLPATTLSLNLLPIERTSSTYLLDQIYYLFLPHNLYRTKLLHKILPRYKRIKETRTACLSEKNIPIEDNAPAHSISGSFVPSTCCKSVYVFSRVCRMRKLSAILTDIRYSKTMPLYLSPTRLIESSFRAKALVLPLLPPHTPPPPARKTLVLPIEGEERNACRRKDEESSVRLSLSLASGRPRGPREWGDIQLGGFFDCVPRTWYITRRCLTRFFLDFLEKGRFLKVKDIVWINKFLSGLRIIRGYGFYF